MKKLFIIAIAAFTFSAASAQGRNADYRQYPYDNNQRNDGWYNKDQRQRDYGYSRNDNRYDGRFDNRNRQAEYDRMNRDYDRRIDGYRNDRSMSRFERDRRIREAEMERQQKQKSFGKGLIVGGIAAVVLGAVLSH